MSERDLFFLVMFLILLTSLTLIIVRWVRSRGRRGSGGSRRGNWWEGPWDEDQRR